MYGPISYTVSEINRKFFPPSVFSGPGEVLDNGAWPQKRHWLKKRADFGKLQFRQERTNFYSFWQTASAHFQHCVYPTFLLLSLCLLYLLLNRNGGNDTMLTSGRRTKFWPNVCMNWNDIMPKPDSLPDFGINAGTGVQESRPGQQRL